MSIYTRKICSTEDCGRLSRNKGNLKGKIIYGNQCEFHHKKTSGKDILNFFLRKNLDNSKCEVCGWGKAYCDRHRINPLLGYIKQNVKILCPNCHRIETIKEMNRDSFK